MTRINHLHPVMTVERGKYARAEFAAIVTLGGAWSRSTVPKRVVEVDDEGNYTTVGVFYSLRAAEGVFGVRVLSTGRGYLVEGLRIDSDAYETILRPVEVAGKNLLYCIDSTLIALFDIIDAEERLSHEKLT